MRSFHLFALFLSLAACSGFDDFKGPSLSGDPSRMSGDTLCYRQAYAKKSDAIDAEIDARHLDCKKILSHIRTPGPGEY